MQCFRQIPKDLHSHLIEVASNIWTLEAKNHLYFRPPAQPSYPYPHRAVVIRLTDNSLFIISPIQLSADIRAAVGALGAVRYLVSPNHVHHLHLGDWGQAYPDAKLYASPRLMTKRRDLTFHKVLSTDIPEPEWAGQIDQVLFGSGNGLMDELVFFHRASGTVIFTDLIMDFDPATFSPIAKVTTRWNQMYQHTPRGIQLAHLFDRTCLHQALQTVRTWKPDHIIVAHSPWLCVDGRKESANFLDAAFDWLTPKPRVLEVVMGLFRFFLLLLVIQPVHMFVVLFAEIISPRIAKW